MPCNNLRIHRQRYLLVIKLQLILGIVASLACYTVDSTMVTGFSALLGMSLVVISTSAYLGLIWSRTVLAAEKVFAQHKKAMIVRYLTNFIGFLVIFTVFKDVNVFALFITYIVTISAYWLSLIIVK